MVALDIHSGGIDPSAKRRNILQTTFLSCLDVTPQTKEA